MEKKAKDPAGVLETPSSSSEHESIFFFFEGKCVVTMTRAARVFIITKAIHQPCGPSGKLLLLVADDAARAVGIKTHSEVAHRRLIKVGGKLIPGQVLKMMQGKEKEVPLAEVTTTTFYWIFPRVKLFKLPLISIHNELLLTYLFSLLSLSSVYPLCQIGILGRIFLNDTHHESLNEEE